MRERPLRADGIELEEVADGYLAVDHRNERVHYLNHTAAMVLELCSGEREVEEIARVLQRTYDLGRPPYEDVSACLGELVAADLVSSDLEAAEAAGPEA